jgi:hypothetical protein
MKCITKTYNKKVGWLRDEPVYEKATITICSPPNAPGWDRGLSNYPKDIPIDTRVKPEERKTQLIVGWRKAIALALRNSSFETIASNSAMVIV